MKKKIIWLVIILIIIIMAVLYYGFLQEEDVVIKGPFEKIIIGATTQELSTLSWVAQNKGYFEEFGLDAEIKSYTTGLGTRDAVFSGEVDVADTVDFVISGLASERNDFKVIASIAEGENNYLIAKREVGIENISDLKGKKIGILEDSSSEYYLGRTLTYNGLNWDDVEKINIHPTKMPEALANNEIDAVVTWHPHIHFVENALKQIPHVWSMHNEQSLYWALIATNDYIEKNPKKIEKLLQALAKAEEFTKANEEEAKEIISKIIDLDIDYLDSVWSGYDYKLGLSQGMIISMEDHNRWRVENNLTTNEGTPNYLDYIYFDALEAVKVEAISIIR